MSSIKCLSSEATGKFNRSPPSALRRTGRLHIVHSMTNVPRDPSGVPFKKGMPEQCALVRHRRTILIRAALIAVPCFLVGNIALDYIRIPESLRGWLPVGAFFFVIGLMVFALIYWRCPACHQYFPRGTEGRFCSNCRTKMEFIVRNRIRIL